MKRANQIIKSGIIKPYTYFSPDYKISRYYGSMVSGKVVTFEVELDNETDFIVGDYIQNLKELSNFKVVNYKK